jgi:hypothetical protein
MKYKITDKQLDDVIFLYLDNQDFIRINMNNSIYFVNSEDDEYSQIRFYYNNSNCYIYTGLIDEVASFFSLQAYDAREAIGRWVEKTLNVDVDYCAWVQNINSILLFVQDSV